MRKMDGGRTLKGFEEQPGTKCSHQNSWSRTPALKVRRSSERLVSFLSTHPPVHLSTPLPICLGQPFRAWRPREGHEADGEQEWRWRREVAGRDFLTTFWCDGGRRNAQDALRPEIPRVSRRQTSVSIFRIGEWESKAERNVAKILELKKCSWLLQWWEESSTVSNSSAGEQNESSTWGISIESLLSSGDKELRSSFSSCSSSASASASLYVEYYFCKSAY